MKGVEFSTWGKYKYYDVRLSFEENENEFVLFVPEKLNDLALKKVKIDKTRWKVSVFNFSWTKYLFLVGIFLVLIFCWGNFFQQVQDLWTGKASLGIGLFLRCLCSACGAALAIMMFFFWIPLIRFNGFLIVSSREKFDEKGKLIKGYVIALENKAELNRVNEMMSLLSKKEKNEKVPLLNNQEERKEKKEKIKRGEVKQND